jgi:hypothetical protein
MAAMGMGATGSIGDANPVEAIGDEVRRETAHPFCAVVLSTLPRNRSRWLRADVPERVAKRHPGLPVTHLVAEDALVD